MKNYVGIRSGGLGLCDYRRWSCGVGEAKGREAVSLFGGGNPYGHEDGEEAANFICSLVGSQSGTVFFISFSLAMQ